MKFLSILIDLILWLWLFVIPTGIMGFIAYNKYYHNPNNLIIPILLLSGGIILGIFLAEIVRRKFGLNYFFSRVKASPDFDKMSQSNEEEDIKKSNG